MSNVEAILIILLVVGVIFSNLAVLKYSAKFKMPQFGDKQKNDEQQNAKVKPNDSAANNSKAQSSYDDDDEEPKGF
ncbi:DUF2897 family protein [Shewanella avicenniae]|uniref:DUF2897 family protein n=1 Tax=Shewanella avicenniae TaxID=2814294 RepID=A0ABX7QKS6_9GAMM|nr:DUF2897 family protein [Shewanella avicenniae]QSX32056.1 DUF2897 family protein [Shewanella avicenniae]